MNRKMADFIILFIWASIVLNASPLYAELEQNTSTGQSWLIQNKQGNEYWGRSIPADIEIDELANDDVSPVSFRDSAEATAALASYGTYTLDYQVAVEWIAAFSAITTEYLARKIAILSAAGSDTSEYLGTLQSYRNKRGCFGGHKNTPCSPLDTALALQALKASNYSETTVLYQAINFLTTNQHSDGGWGFYPSTGSGQALTDPSNTYVTAMVLRALSGYSSQFSVQSSVSNATAFLLAKQTQNNDGGFGSSPSTVYETALSVMALIESGQGAAQALQSGINYLTNTQLPNGSWNDDPYSTALALQALANVRPNLQLSSISLSKPMPREGESVTITAAVANTGLEAASNVIVRFYLGDPSTGSGQVPAAGGVQIGTDQVIPLIAIGSSAQASITQSFTGSGAKTVYAVVDPDTIISETNENDNS